MGAEPESIQTQLAVLIQSIAALSESTCNHDKLLTKLIDDHEVRLRAAEKCIYGLQCVPELERRVNDIEINGSKTAENLTVVVSSNSGKVDALATRVGSLENWRWYLVGFATAVGIIAGLVVKFL